MRRAVCSAAYALVRMRSRGEGEAPQRLLAAAGGAGIDVRAAVGCADDDSRPVRIERGVEGSAQAAFAEDGARLAALRAPDTHRAVVARGHDEVAFAVE